MGRRRPRDAGKTGQARVPSPADLRRVEQAGRPHEALPREGKQERVPGRSTARRPRAVLASPSFLFRPEADARPDDPTAKRLLNDYELATRLSYFLWSSMPDDTLLGLADQGKAQRPTGSRGAGEAHAQRPEVERAGRQLRRTVAPACASSRSSSPTTRRSPSRSAQAMAAEPARFFTGVVQEDRSVLEFLDADYTYVNDALARHYGLSGVTGEKLQKVALPKSRGGGLLGMAGGADPNVEPEPHQPGETRQVGARQYSGNASPASPAGECPRARQARRRPARGRDVAKAAGAPPDEPGMRQLSRADGPDRPRAGELRPAGPLAR